MKNKLKKYFKNVCLETSKLSTCVSRQVGAVLVRDNRIIASGYNGVPSGVEHCNQVFINYEESAHRKHHHEWSKYNENHAEQNLIAFCAKNGLSTDECVMFLSISPCINCAKLILNTGIKKIIYLEKYDKDTEGIEFLNNNEVICEQWTGR